MLWIVFLFLLALWLAGMVASYTLGGVIHVLLGLAVLVLLAQVITREHEPAAGARVLPSKEEEPKKADDKTAA